MVEEQDRRAGRREEEGPSKDELTCMRLRRVWMIGSESPHARVSLRSSAQQGLGRITRMPVQLDQKPQSVYRRG
eukprot:scaffold30437_cov51-Isochrysis_galbana.AAC.1